MDWLRNCTIFYLPTLMESSPVWHLKSLHLCTPLARVFNFGTIDILAQIILWGGCCPMHCKMFHSIYWLDSENILTGVRGEGVVEYCLKGGKILTPFPATTFSFMMSHPPCDWFYFLLPLWQILECSQITYNLAPTSLRGLQNFTLMVRLSHLMTEFIA